MLAHEALVSYGKREEEKEKEREMKGGQEEEEDDEVADGSQQQQQQQRKQLPLPQPLRSCRTPRDLRSVAPDPQDGDVQRGRVQSDTIGDEASQHEQQPQQQQREKDEKTQVWRKGQQHNVQHGGGVTQGMEAGGCWHWDLSLIHI